LRLLLPRSGLERSDFVPWPMADMAVHANDVRFEGLSRYDLTGRECLQKTQIRTHAPQQSSSHSIISSARPNSESGTVRPSALEWTVIIGTNRALPSCQNLWRASQRMSTVDKLS
jgi:hypothetical protein